MLILTDSNELGDKRLSPEEGIVKLKEDNQKLIDAKKMPNQKLLENHEAAFGNPMAHSELIRRIQKLNRNIIVEDGGVPGAVAVRYPGLDDETGLPTKKYVTGFYKQPLPEFSSVIPYKGLPYREVRGWRSVLLSLIRGNILTYKQVNAAFGEPLGQRSILWREQTQNQRA